MKHVISTSRMTENRLIENMDLRLAVQRYIMKSFVTSAAVH
jgi:hypothetical protein